MKTCVIIDDEKDAVNVLKMLLIEKCPDVKILGEANSALEGIKLIKSVQPQIVFLDIEMPHGTGFDLLEGIPERNFHVIFVTAFSNYAVKAFKFNAIDFLVKPVNMLELEEAVKKVDNTVSRNEVNVKYESLLQYVKQMKSGKIGIPSSDGIEFFEPDDIIYLEADGSYTKIITKTTTFLASKYLKEIQVMLDDERFYRPHNSFIINLKYVKKYNSKEAMIVMNTGAQINIARAKSEDFMNNMKKFR